MAEFALWEKIRLNIRDLMESQKITHAELAKRTGMPGPQVSHYLGGRNTPGIDKLPLFAEALGVTVNDLLGESSRATPALRKPTPEEFAAAFIEGYPLEAKRKAICLLALTAKANIVEIMHDTALSAYFEPVKGGAADHNKPSVG